MLRSNSAFLWILLTLWGGGIEAFVVVPRVHQSGSIKNPLRYPPYSWQGSSPQVQVSAVAPEVFAAASVPSIRSVALACLIPSLLGFYKSEYGVSYAYGGAIATTAWMVLQGVPITSLAGLHSLALLVYGLRLNLFLLYREVNIPRFRDFREKIEDRAQKKGSRIARTPFVVSVAVLYACMATPLFVTVESLTPFWSFTGGWRINAARILIATTWAGFLLGAVGDTTKSFVKATNGADYLVTEGVFRFFRHPNYTGEFLGWTASALAAIVLSGASWLSLASAVGALGIDFVLVQAATGLERKQLEKYGKTESYKKWIQQSWAGVTMKTPKQSVNDYSI